MEKENISSKVAEALHRIPPPVIVDLGSRSTKSIKKLKNGTGKLMVEVEQAIEQVHSGLPDGDKDKQIIPVLVIYKKKSKRKSSSLSFSPLSPLSLFR